MFEITHNHEHNGIEIEFDGKPEADVLDFLKNNRFRWHRVKKVWFAKESGLLLDIETLDQTLKNLVSGEGLKGIIETSWGLKEREQLKLLHKPKSYEDLIDKALICASDASDEKIRELRQNGDKYNVTNHGVSVGRLLDTIGFASIHIMQKRTINGDLVKNVEFLKYIKRRHVVNSPEECGYGFSKDDPRQMKPGRWYYESPAGSFTLSIGYPRGFTIYIADSPEITGPEFQYMGPKVAAVREFSRVLDESDIIARPEYRED